MQFIYLLIFILRILLKTKGIDLADLHLLYPEWDMCESNRKFTLGGHIDSPEDKSPKYHVIEKKAQNANGSWNIPDSASQTDKGAWSNSNNDTGSDNNSDSDSDNKSTTFSDDHNFLFNADMRPNPSANTNPEERPITLREVLTEEQILRLVFLMERITETFSYVEDLQGREGMLRDYIREMEQNVDTPEQLDGNERYLNLQDSCATTRLEMISRMHNVRRLERDLQQIWPDYVSNISPLPFEVAYNRAPQGLDG